MTDRELMQQALDAIRIFREWEMGQDYDSNRDTVLVRAFAAEEALETALAQPEQEPVAWSFEARHIDTAWGLAVSLKHPGQEHKYLRNVNPLYTAPPQRTPLTKEQLLYVYNQIPNWGMDMDNISQDLVAFARAIEKAHNIREKE